MYEIGKIYEFNRNDGDFVLSREGGKLVFIITDKDGDPIGKVAPFEFQLNEHPEVIECICRGEGKFEQTQSSVLQKVYVPGNSYTFKVWRTTPSQGLLLRDEANGLTHSNMRIPGTAGVKRFDEIECTVLEVDGEGIRLQYNGARRFAPGAFTLKTLMENERLRSKPWIRVAQKIMEWDIVAEAREMALRGDGSWVAMTFQTLLRILPQWIAEAPCRRRIWVSRLNEVIRIVVESPAYASAFNFNKARLRSQRHELARGLEQLDYIGRAADLVASPEKAEAMIENTLDTMRHTGWVFEPNKRMGVLMQVLAMAPGLGHSHTAELFEIIRTRRGNRDFMLIFSDAFEIMLKTYIESERTAPDQLARPSLRELAEAIAIELLLVKDTNFELWDTHRGTLYTVAALLTGHSGEAPIRKAMLTYCGLNDTSLEFGWEDLGDINRVCLRLLATGHDEVATGVEAVFEGEDIRMRAVGKQLYLQPAGTDAPMRTVLSGPLASDLSFAIRLPERIVEKGGDDLNLTRQRLMWEEVAKSLSSNAPQTAGTQPSEPDEPEGIVITGPSPTERFEFECRSIDGSLTGTIAVRDIVPYPVSTISHLDIFNDDDTHLPLRLPGEVIEQLSDNRARFSLRRKIMEINARDARQDMAQGTRLLAKVTDVSGFQYKATTEYGYGILLAKRDVTLNLGDVIEVRIDSVNYRPDDWKLYINSSWLRTITDADDDEVLDTMLRMAPWQYGAEALHGLMCDNFEPIEEPLVAIAESEPESVVVEQEIRYVSEDTVANLSFLLEQSAALQRSDLKQSYTLLWLARLLADMASDRGRSEALEVQLRLLETLSHFAADSRIELEPALTLIERGRRLQSTSALLRSRLKEVAILVGLDNQTFLSRVMEWAQRGADEHINALSRLVAAYNTLEGLGAADIRDALRRRINDLLSLPTVISSTPRLNVSEDLYHEFKTSAIFPPDNRMQPDERAQSYIISRVVASFLNTEGGTIYLGVDNAGNLRGLDNDFRYLAHGATAYDIREVQDKYNLYLQKGMRYHLGTTADGRALIPDFIDIQYEKTEGLWICRITVRPFPKAIMMKPDDKLFIRRIGETVEVTDPAEKRLFIERRNR